MSSCARILLVDDDAPAREALRGAIAQVGCQVDVADSIQQARERLAEFDYALVYADLRLPDGSGMELIQPEGADRRSLLVIVTTKEASLQSSVQALNLGARGYIVKPYHADEVRARTQAAVREFESGERHRRALTRAQERAQFYERLAMVDSLTGLFNQRYFRVALRREVQAARRYGRPLSLLLADIDHFKRFNDVFGHAVGDHCLRHVATKIQAVAREADTVARWGGEEFATILPETALDGATECAHRMSGAVASSPPAPLDSHPLPAVTVSVGVASLQPACEDADSLFLAADTALYRAKRAGRNQVMTARPAERAAAGPSPRVPVR